MATALAASALAGCSGGSDSETTAAATAETTTAAAETGGSAAAGEETTASEPETTQEAAGEGALQSLRGNENPTDEEIELANTTLDDSYLSDVYSLGSDYSAYPYPEDVTLDIWMPNLYDESIIWGTMDEHPVVKKMQELTGIKVHFITPAATDVQSQFNLMLGEPDEIPDIIFQVGSYYPGGLTAAANEGLILDLTQYEDQLPNYMAMLEANEQRKKESSTDDGQMLCLYEQVIEPMGPVCGPMIRQEALDKTGWTEIPETIDEWHEFLTACKEAGYRIPLEFRLPNGFATNGAGFPATAYGVSAGLQVIDGVVSFGPMQDGLKDYLATMKQWYDEGLIDPDCTTADVAYTATLLSGDECAVDCTYGGTMTYYGHEYVPALNAVLNKGDRPSVLFAPTSIGTYAGITQNCDNVDAALAFLDFGYSKKGWELHNYGAYGDVHLVDADGMPYFHENSLIYTDEEIQEMGGNYGNSKYKFHHFVGAHDEYGTTSYNDKTGRTKLEQQRAKEEMDNIGMPNVSLTTEEVADIEGIATDLNTAVSEYCLKVILGQAPMESIDELRQKLIDFGVEKYVAVYQAAYDRFMAR